MASSGEIVRTVTEIITKAATASAKPTSNAVPPQGGVLENVNPADYDAKNPIITFIIQVNEMLLTIPPVPLILTRA
jgi:hypothetical protein